MRRDDTQSIPPDLATVVAKIRRGQRLGKYKILRRLGEGGAAEVHAALDTVEGVRVALKIPRGPIVAKGTIEDLLREIRLAARLHHPNILPLKSADFIDGRLVIATALGDETLAERLTRRLATARVLDLAEQALAAVAYAHEKGVIHCDIKPENLILFGGDLLRLTDFGIAKVTRRTVRGSGSGTVGYVAPEQAMGKPSRRSDVFSLGLVIYQMLAGELPEWPFEWPPDGHQRIRRKAGQPVLEVLARALALNPRKRFPDAGKMLSGFRAGKRHAPKSTIPARAARPAKKRASSWQQVRWREFSRRYGKALEARHACARCDGPVSEAMTTCPWCGDDRRLNPAATSFPAQCPRCRRGVKLDWKYCAWCHGPGFEPHGKRQYTDRRYAGRCHNDSCERRELMPFMRYCPWCRRKVKRAWKISGEKATCSRCKWGVAAEFWSFCPWCGAHT